MPVCGPAWVESHVQPLQAQILIDQDHPDTVPGPAFFGDSPGVANPVQAFAVHAMAGFDAGCFYAAVTDGIDGCGVVFNAFHGCRHIGYEFVAAHADDHMAWPKGNGCGAVAHHIQVDQLAAFSQGVGAGEK